MKLLFVFWQAWRHTRAFFVLVRNTRGHVFELHKFFFTFFLNVTALASFSFYLPMKVFQPQHPSCHLLLCSRKQWRRGIRDLYIEASACRLRSEGSGGYEHPLNPYMEVGIISKMCNERQLWVGWRGHPIKDFQRSCSRASTSLSTPLYVGRHPIRKLALKFTYGQVSNFVSFGNQETLTFFFHFPLSLSHFILLLF